MPSTSTAMESRRRTFNLRSQLFRRRPRTFLPFNQHKTPSRAEEWIDNLGEVPVPSADHNDSSGTLEVYWLVKTQSPGSFPMMHTLFHNGKAQSVWDPMPEDMLIEYLDTIANIPYDFQNIVEEYLPRVFDPIRRGLSTNRADAPAPRRWYPKPILVAACIFAERRILDDPRTYGSSNDDSDDSDEESWPGADLYNRYADRDESGSELEDFLTNSMIPSAGYGLDAAFHGFSDNSDIGSESGSVFSCDCSNGDSDGGSDSADDSEFSLDREKTGQEGGDDRSEAAEASEDDDDTSDDEDDDDWDVSTIDMKFHQTLIELEQRGLELPLY
ncbi:hypothetical protein MMC07_001713 [Pseudocyphellaria aurata]|nr:hypothetical protein [Pseudocyphellaria aurata]